MWLAFEQLLIHDCHYVLCIIFEIIYWDVLGLGVMMTLLLNRVSHRHDYWFRYHVNTTIRLSVISTLFYWIRCYIDTVVGSMSHRHKYMNWALPLQVIDKGPCNPNVCVYILNACNHYYIFTYIMFEYVGWMYLSVSDVLV